MKIVRRQTRQVRVGKVAIGGGAAVSVQTMTNADPHDEMALLKQINEAAELGCDIVRLTVPDMEAARVFGLVRQASPVPLVADIHFKYELALAAAEAGADGLRLNPGNIGKREHIELVAREAAARGIPIRIGVNGGSLERDILERFGGSTPEALVESALRHVALLEDVGFGAIKISVKASDVLRTVAAYRLLAERCDYPLHLGVTEAGTFIPGTVRSCVALGALLFDGIGDTIRVSLSDTPAREVRVGVELLRSLELRASGAAVTSCPTCGRTKVDVARLAQQVEERLESYYRENPLAARPRVAVMGCIVNGPGEAKGADIAVAGGAGVYALYVGGEMVGRVSEADAQDEIVARVRGWGEVGTTENTKEHKGMGQGIGDRG